MRRKSLLSVLVMLSLAACGGGDAKFAFPRLTPAAWAPYAGRYQLTTEKALPAVYDREILPLYRGGAWNHFAGRGGVSIYYKKFVEPGDRGAVVISNGRTESMAAYPEVIRDLKRQHYSVYILDHRGQGFSERLIKDEPHKSYVDDFDDYVEDLHTFVAREVKPANHPKVFLLAHSMGGGIAARYIEKYPHDFNAAVLVTPMLEPMTKILGADMTPVVDWANWLIPRRFARGYGIFQDGYGSLQVRNDLTHSRLRYLKMHERYAEEAAVDAGRPTRDPVLGGVTHGWLRQAFDAAKLARSAEEAAKIKIPVLIFQASGDTAVRGPAQVEFCRRINDKHPGLCQGWTLEGAYHAVLMEDDAYRIPALTMALQFFDRS